MDLRERWPLGGGQGLRDRLLAAWSGPERGYHDAAHLAEVLDRLEELARAGESFPSATVVLAAWFHDAVYDGRAGAEERSARWAEEALPDVVDAGTVAEVARLVRLTATHRPAEGDLAGAALCDADLAILAAPAGRYAAYVAGVRREHAHLADADFAAGRAAVLADLLARHRLFTTPHARARWEPAARANVAAELRRHGGAAGRGGRSDDRTWPG